MPLPNFLIVGAPRCATTTLHYVLAGHEQVRMTDIKEPNHFLFDADGTPSVEERSILTKSVRSRPAYEALFGRPGPGEVLRGDASPLYLYVEEAMPRIHDACPDARIVAVVRDPVERAWSHFLHAFKGVKEEDAVERFAALAEAEMAAGTSYEPYRTPTHLLRLGRYGSQLPRWFDAFGRDRVLVLLLEDIDADPDGSGARLCDFLGIDPISLGVTYNSSGRAPSSPLGSVLGSARATVGKVQPLVKSLLPPRIAGRLGRLRAKVDDRSLHPVPFRDEALRRRLQDWYADDVEALSTLLGRDLGHWSR